MTSSPSRTQPMLALAAIAVMGAIAGTRAAAPFAVRRAFRAWSAGVGSIYDLMDGDARIVIPGTAAHCGTYRKDAFLREVAIPFVARFATPPVPRLRTLWSGTAGIVVVADATGTTRDGRPYRNDYVFLFEMTGRRVTKVTEFLDMVAFNAVWDQVEPEPAGAG